MLESPVEQGVLGSGSVGARWLGWVMNHPVLSAIAAIHAALDEIAGVDPIYMSVAEKKTAMVESARLRARAEALDLQLSAAAEIDVAEETGSRSTAVWLADQTREAHGTVRHRAALAKALEKTWTHTGAALAAGRVNLAQVRAITESLQTLPDDLPDGVLAKAETYLLEQAAALGPRELRHLGRGVLHHLAPEIADAADLRRLHAEDARAEATTQLRLRRRGDGTDEGWFRLPSHATGRLRAYLDAIASPRRPDNDDDFMALPQARRRGIAFQSLLETVLETDLPVHGRTATSIVVTIDHTTLLTGLGTATTSTGETITAAQARRLACNAGILPAVLGTNSEILDLGRTSRFFTGPTRKAMDLRDKECTTRGCHIPAAFCHGHHHRQPWAAGGPTNLTNGKLLCPHHHHHAHNPHWTTHHHPDGTTTFTRRQ
jgi:hypothetical protein